MSLLSTLRSLCGQQCCLWYVHRPALSRLYVYLMVTLTVLSFVANAVLDVVTMEAVRVCIVSPPVCCHNEQVMIVSCT